MEEQATLIALDGLGCPGPAGTKEPEAAPKIKRIDRRQSAFVALDVENLVSADDKVRAIWDLTGKMDFSDLLKGIVSKEGSTGQAHEDPRLLVAIWVWAYSEGISSSRQIEDSMAHEPALMWLSGLRTISHASLSNFRKDHRKELEGLFTQLLGLLERTGAVKLDRVMHDGTKIRAQAGIDTLRRERTLRESLAKAATVVRDMEKAEAEATSRQKAARQRAARERAERLEEAVKELEALQAEKKKEEEKKNVRVSTTEPEARLMRHGDGAIGLSYNAQITTDAVHKVIVAASLSKEESDAHGLIPALRVVKENVGREPKQVVADGGYTNRANIRMMDERGVDFIGSLGAEDERRGAAVQASGIHPKFAPQFFILQPETRTLECPAGKHLHYVRKNKVRGDLYHRYQAAASDCGSCPHQRLCCPKHPGRGRAVCLRVAESPDIACFRRRMQSEEAKAIYKQRGAVAEFPNAWIKERIGLRKFSLRGLVKAGIELTWACLTYNVMIWVRLHRRGLITAPAA
jgi:transposase